MIERNLLNIRKAITKALRKSNKTGSDVKILPITKNRRVDVIKELVKFGFTEIGENRISEIEEKYPYVCNSFKIHLVGKLQKNKVKLAINLIEFIHSIDSLELAKTIENELAKKGKELKGLIEVNIAKEKSKSGVYEEDLPNFLKEVCNFKFLKIVGFMTMPPQTQNPESSRPFFRKLRELLDKYSREKFENLQLTQLSMGTTQDYTVAVEEGATIIRIGEALFSLPPLHPISL